MKLLKLTRTMRMMPAARGKRFDAGRRGHGRARWESSVEAVTS